MDSYDCYATLILQATSEAFNAINLLVMDKHFLVLTMNCYVEEIKAKALRIKFSCFDSLFL